MLRSGHMCKEKCFIELFSEIKTSPISGQVFEFVKPCGVKDKSLNLKREWKKEYDNKRTNFYLSGKGNSFT